MEIKPINRVDELIEAVPQFPEEWMELPESSRKLLGSVYSKATGVTEGNPSKPPLIISFHPKASLLNNNIHETFLSEKIADKLDMIPIWIPYVYDTGYKTAADKIRLPTYVHFEGKSIPLRSSALIRGNITATEDPLTDKEVKAFFRELEKHELSTLTRLKGMLNPFNFGHHIFDLKRQVSGVRNKDIRARIGEMEKLWLNAIKGSRNLSESLARISLANLREFDINVGLFMMDDILQEFSRAVFSEVLETQNVKDDPCLLDNLFLAYDLKTKERTPITYSGNLQFGAFDDVGNRTFEGSFDNLVTGLGDHSILPTGRMIISLFTAMGCKLVLGGQHTVDYYPDYFRKASTILGQTTYNSRTMLFSYGDIRFIDLRNMYDVMSAVRVLNKVGSRNYITKGVFRLPDDIVDHLNFLGGPSSVPSEYASVLERITEGHPDRQTTYQKEKARHSEIETLLEKPPEELLKDTSILSKWLKDTKFEELHPVKLEVMLDNLKEDSDMRLRKLEEYIEFEKHILGGSVTQEGETESLIADGILLRSKRSPTLFEMVFYKAKRSEELDAAYLIKDHESEWVWKQIVCETRDDDTKEFHNYKNTFDHLIPSKVLAGLIKPDEGRKESR